MLTLYRDMFRDKDYLKKTLAIALPVSLQAMLNMIINLVDTVMIGTLGETAIASVALANKVFFVYILLIFGISSGTSVLAAHYWGNKDIKNIRKVLGISLMIAIAGALLFTCAAYFIPEKLMNIFTLSPETIKLGASYLSIVCIAYPFIAVTNIYVSAMRSVEEVKAPVIISFVTIAINVLLNYIFIFGKLGLPAMGVTGAATATVISRIFEMSAIFITIRLIKSPLVCKIRDMFGYNRALINQFLITALPVIGNEFMWGIGTTLYSVAYGRMGDTAVAAIAIASTFQDLMKVFFQGIAAATIVVLGNEMGANHIKKAEKYAQYFLALTFIVSIFISTVTISLSDFYISFYEVSPNVVNDIKLCIIIYALYLPIISNCTTNIVGILRSGGDTRICFLIDTSGVWLIGIPLAFIGGLVWKLPIYWVYALVNIENIFKAIVAYIRYRQKKWLKNLALELTEPIA